MTSPTVREQLMSGTLAYLSSNAARDTSVRALAAASGRSTMCVYSKFGSRDALLSAVFDQAAQQCLSAIEFDDGTSTVEGRYSEWASRHPGLYQILFEHDLTSLGVDATHRTALIHNVLAVFARRSNDDAKRLWSATHGAIVLDRLTKSS